MYRHVIVPVDCSKDAQKAAPQLAAFLAPLVPCQITLVVATSPSATEEQRTRKVEHAHQALQTIGDIFFEIGVYTRRKIVEGVEDGDIARAVALESRRPQGSYDMILLGSYQARQEEFDEPCQGSVADRICGRVNIPVLVLPTRPRVA